MKKIRRYRSYHHSYPVPLIISTLILGFTAGRDVAAAQTPVLTRAYDNTRSGANTRETIFTPANVKQHGLKRVRRLAVPDDPRIEAQPLYVPQVTMSDGRKHNVVFICSMGNTGYAYDVDNGALLWKQPIGDGKPITPRVLHAGEPGFDPNVPGRNEIDLWRTNNLWGVLSTPVIDAETKTMYVVNWFSPDGTMGHAQFHLNALDIVTGKAKRTPVEIHATALIGTPAAQFDGHLQKQRAALLLTRQTTSSGQVRKTLFIACGVTKETAEGHHGWVLAVDTDAFKVTAAWCSTPTMQGGGIWQAGAGPAADTSGDVYVMSSNGGFNGNTTAATDFSECFIRLHYTPPATAAGMGTITTADWWSPFRDNDRVGDFKDQDLGSGGPILVPGTATGTGFLLGAGKDGILYVFDKNDLGKAFRAFNKLKSPPLFVTFDGSQVNPTGDIDQNFGGKTHHLHGAPVFWNSPDRGGLLFNWGENESLRAWSVSSGGAIKFLAKGNEVSSQGLQNPGGMPGGMITLSARAGVPHTGIVWATAPINGDANKKVVAGIVRAYDASTFNNQSIPLLWDSGRVPAATFLYDKFCSPVIADGHLLVATYDGHVDVYTLNQ